MVDLKSMNILRGNAASPWEGALYDLLQTCRHLAKKLQYEILTKGLAQPICLTGSLRDEQRTSLETIDTEYPLELKSPFENIESVAGGIWPSADGKDDALLKLRFASGTKNLPVHSHDFSNRVIIALSGSGTYHYRSESNLNAIEVKPGRVLAFSQGLEHTFRTDADDLLLLSYHTPFIPLDDPRQYRIAE